MNGKSTMKFSMAWIAGFAGVALITLAVSQCYAQQSYGSPPILSTNQETIGQLAQTNNVANLEARARQTINTFKRKDSTLQTFFEKAAGYAVFPSIGEGAILVGGAYGKGLVYQNGEPIGETTLAKGTVGAEAGAESFSELIFFQSEQSLQQFKQGTFQFSAGVNAVVANAGVGAATNYRNGVAVFTTSRTGLMAKAAIGGQKFTFQPLAMGGAATGTDTGTSSGAGGNAPSPTGGSAH
jgi:lipid-binding SYLF domain-containing protein